MRSEDVVFANQYQAGLKARDYIAISVAPAIYNAYKGMTDWAELTAVDSYKLADVLIAESEKVRE